jgi:hypothetical protein
MRDSDAKEIIKSRWPEQLPFNSEWQRIRTNNNEKSSSPYLMVPGSRACSIYSDCLYAYFHQDEKKYIEYVDILAVEVSGSQHNFYDKRSRYAEHNPLALYCQPAWLRQATFIKDNSDTDLQNIPVRYRATLFVLRDDELELVKKHLVPWGTEYYVGYSALKHCFYHFQRMLPAARYLDATNA